MFQCSVKLAIVINYEVHKEFITANFCINKQKPQLQCNGKCHLSKQIKAQEAKTNSLASILKNIEEVPFYFPAFLFCKKVNSYKIIKPVYLQYTQAFYKNPILTIDQPPQ